MCAKERLGDVASPVLSLRAPQAQTSGWRVGFPGGSPVCTSKWVLVQVKPRAGGESPRLRLDPCDLTVQRSKASSCADVTLVTR